MEELLLRKAPELLDNFFEEILQMQTDHTPDVRKQLVDFIENATSVWEAGNGIICEPHVYLLFPPTA